MSSSKINIELEQAMSNEDIWMSSSSNAPRRFSIMTYNINCSLLAMIPQDYLEKYSELSIKEIIEKFPEICSQDWLGRLARIEALIKKYDSDIVCIQELRKLPNCANPVIWLHQTFGEEYEIFYTKRNATDLAFGQAILWKYDKFSPLAYDKKWISPTPNIPSNGFQSNGKGFGQTAVGVLLHPCENGKFIREAKPFWVYNVHLLLEEELKTKSCMMLGEMAKNLDRPAIFAGDFNLFPDKDGGKQAGILGKCFEDLTKDSKTSQGDRPLRGTFIGTKHDRFRKMSEKALEVANLNEVFDSKLDHILGTKGITLATSTPLVITETMLPVEPKEFDVMVNGELSIDYPSDHMPVLTKFSAL